MALVLILISIFSIQLGAAFAKTLFSLVGPIATTSLRLPFAAILLIAFWRPWKNWPTTREQWRNVALYGVTLGSMNLVFYLSLARIPLGLAVALEFCGPLGVAIYASRKPRDFLFALSAAVGIFLLLPTGVTNSTLDPVGIALALLAGFFWGLYIIFGQRVGKTLHPGTATSLGMVAASLVAIPFGIAYAGESLFTWKVIGFGLLIAVLSSAIPYSLEMIALKKLPAKTFGILMSLEPAVAAVLGYFILQEYLTGSQLVALGLIVFASVGATLSAKETQNP